MTRCVMIAASAQLLLSKVYRKRKRDLNFLDLVEEYNDSVRDDGCPCSNFTLNSVQGVQE